MNALPEMDGSQPCATVDPESFFPHDTRAEYRATILCYGCPYTGPCLEYAIANDVHGVWGGTTHEQRRDLRRQAGIRAAVVTGRQASHTREADAQRALRARRGVA